MMGFDSEDTPQLEILDETFKDFTATELISDEPLEDEQ